MVVTLADFSSLGSQSPHAFHAVLYDQSKTDVENDEFYYFKNSYGPKEPHIKVPKRRGTFRHFQILESAQNHNLDHFLDPRYQKKHWLDIKRKFVSMVDGLDLNVPPGDNYHWTVAETFLLSISKV